ncbi:MAG TPA: hypothetical protein VHC48_13480 [Puia sp.]|nr:hypothetical protein [Puia sp.]
MDNRDIPDWDIQIDRIVIEGMVLTSFQRQQLRMSLEEELGRLFEGKGIPGNMRNIRGKVTGAPIELGEKAAPVQLGKQVAASVYSSLSGE